MGKQFIYILTLAAVSGILFFASQDGNEIAYGFFLNTVLLLIVYTFFLVLLQEYAGRYIKDAKSRYSFRKVIDVLFWGFFILGSIGIWVKDPQALFVSYGLIAAAITVTLQDVFKNFAGGVIIITNRLFEVGDRIELSGRKGDVIDIGLLYTTLMEIQEWIDADQHTGRIISLPNSLILSNTVQNYTKDFSFIWDEIMIPITYDSNAAAALELLKEIAHENTHKIRSTAQKEMRKLRKKYFVSEKHFEAQVFMKATDNWIELSLRYTAKARERRIYFNDLQEDIIQAFYQHPDIHIASETLSIIDFPKQ